ncbi:MAG: hypothetical protein PHU01_08290 [Desulfuromonadaceae bacterium]|nr:hypothetical protein [Desulfuromonadaceae bacterium]
MKNTLKMLLGDQWERVCIHPEKPLSVGSFSDESREDADKLVDDLLSDLEKSGFSHLDEVPAVGEAICPADSSPLDSEKRKISSSDGSANVVSEKVQPTTDELADLLLANASKSLNEEQSVRTKAAPVAPTAPKPSEQQVSAPLKSPAVVPKKADPPVAPQAAEFVIKNDKPASDETIPEDLLLAFEDNYRSESRFFNRTVASALIILSCAGAGWYFLKHPPGSTSSVKNNVSTTSSKLAAPAKVIPVESTKKKVSASAAVPDKKTGAVASAMPSFIPTEGKDSSYSAKNPGWERYLGKKAEFRVFKDSGKIKAIQVLSVKKQIIQDEFIESILQEFTGSQEYKVTSQKTKAGFHIDSGRIQNKHDILIYRKGGVTKAFVVSLN